MRVLTRTTEIKQHYRKEKAVRLREEEEYYRRGIYRRYLEIKNTGLSKKAAIEKMVDERLNLEERFERYIREREYELLERIINSERSKALRKEREEQALIAECKRLEGRTR